MAAAREKERDRCYLAISELRETVNHYEANRSELESRCENYMNELQDARVEHDMRSKAAKAQIEGLLSEAVRAQNMITALRDSLIAEELKNKTLSLDLIESRTNLSNLSATAKSWRSELVQVSEERTRLARQCDKLEASVEHLTACRSNDFNNVAESVVTVMGRELEAMRVNMGIPPRDS